MSEHYYHDIAASVRQRLLNHAHRNAEPFDLVLTKYAQERLLYRLGESEWRNKFLLNGIQFLTDTVRGTEIREANIYAGVRIKLIAQLAGAKIPLQIDIGFGDAVTPAPEKIKYPTLLEFPAPQLSAYPHYSVVSEKLQAIVMLGIANSRMKDFYDLWIMARRLFFDGSVLCRAISATFKRRSTILPQTIPIALTDTFANDPIKNTQWNAFLRKNQPWIEARKLNDVLMLLKDFLMPPLSSLMKNDEFSLIWSAGGSWKKG